MKTLPALVAAFVVALLVLPASSRAEAERPLASIERLDLKRYAGRWHEIARLPNRFQRKCVGDVSADYALLNDGRVQVINRCRVEGGGMEEATGIARQVGDATSPRLKVRFAPDWLSFLPFVWGDYWVVDLDSDYALAAVSEPQREYLWVLSRTPQVDATRYAELLKRLKAQGLPVERLERTVQGNALQQGDSKAR